MNGAILIAYPIVIQDTTIQDNKHKEQRSQC